MTNDNRHASAVDELSERFWDAILDQDWWKERVWKLHRALRARTSA